MCVSTTKINSVGKWTSLNLEGELFDNSPDFSKHHTVALNRLNKMVLNAKEKTQISHTNSTDYISIFSIIKFRKLINLMITVFVEIKEKRETNAANHKWVSFCLIFFATYNENFSKPSIFINSDITSNKIISYSSLHILSSHYESLWY